MTAHIAPVAAAFRISLRPRALATASVLALTLGAVAPAHAQGADAAVENVTVTSTRIQRDGYSAPTPTTVFSTRDIENSGQTTVFAAVNQLPSLAGSNSTQTFGTTQSTGTGGLSTLNLRGLGTNRTLTLLDGQRVVGALTIGVTDAGAFPQALVQRVDIVTGGASASWGSDAVAGVVNYVLDHDFTGFKANLIGGVTTYGDDQQGALSLTGGTGFAGGRGHFEASGEMTYNAGVPRGIGGRRWYDATRILQRSIAATPAGTPQYTAAPHVVDFQIAPGGIITAGPLLGTAFGPGGRPFAYQYGNPQATPFMQGGDQTSDIGNNSNLDSTLGRAALYARVSYDLTPSTNIYATVNYGTVRTSAHSYPGEYRTANLTIQCDNAFLPASVAAGCATNHITNFQYGTFMADLPDSVAVNNRTMKRATAGADGSFDALDTKWSWSAYATHGETYDNNSILNNGLNGRILASIDAVNGPNGQIVCRSAVAQAAGCVPLNIIGTGVASQSALNYIKGTPYLQTWLRQEAAAFTVNGEPVSTWAGPVSLATGVEYREEATRGAADVYSQGNGGDPVLSAAGNNWFTGNFHPYSGNFHVTEGFVELLVPLLNSTDWGKLDLNLAGRAESYSTAGYVNTWKVGATWETPLSGVRLRALQSRDIRAPNLSELFTASASFTGTIIDQSGPFAGQSFTVQTPTVGNRALLPEKSQTTELGVVYQPDWLPGFSASLDYYRIAVKGAIGSVGAQQEVNLCALGNTAACAFVSRDSSGKITQVVSTSINLSSTLTDGFDVESSYQMDAGDLITGWDGSFTLRALATHVSKYINNSGLPGAISSELSGAYGAGNIPLWRLYTTQGYSNDLWSMTLTERWVSDGVLNRAWIQCATGCPLPTINNPTVNDNTVNGAFYVDIGGSYNLTTSDNGGIGSQVYFKIDNLADVDPSKVAYSGANPYLVRAVNSAVFDMLGRTYRIGIRVNTN
jgi:outer membrane receptor protein involved in Fe transport